jgi:predicted enzyme related to lactoylglutathione lyase
MKNPIVHFEFYADDPDKLQQFYSSLFDWTFETMPGGMDYRLVKTVDTDDKGMPIGRGVNGGMMKRPAGFQPRATVNYVSVESLDASLKKAEALGATVTMPRSPVPGMGWFAMLMDPQGNHFAMWQTDPSAK